MSLSPSVNRTNVLHFGRLGLQLVFWPDCIDVLKKFCVFTLPFVQNIILAITTTSWRFYRAVSPSLRNIGSQDTISHTIVATLSME
jgi:hypothetical protein